MIAAGLSLSLSHSNINSADSQDQNGARKFPHLEGFCFFFNFNCYPGEGPTSSFEEIYSLVRFAVMIIIVTVKKNTLIVSSELRMLHKHDLISPLNGAGIVNFVFQKKDTEAQRSPMP